MKMKRVFLLILLFMLWGSLSLRGQEVALKTNLLYLATTTPNLGVEWRMGGNYTGAVTVGYNPFRLGQYLDAEGNTVNPKLRHWLAATEVRYWFCDPYMGWNIGVNLFGGEYNAGGIRFIHALKEGRYKGWAAGAGLTAGYHIPLSARWGLDLSLGMGYIYARYTQYDCYACGDKKDKYKKNYMGPTKAAVSLVYFMK